MSQPLRLRIHVNEPFDFERENASSDLFGTTVDHEEEDADEWCITLETGFSFNEEYYEEMLLSPRYVGEHPSRVFDSYLGFPVRLAHRTEDGWHFAMTGMISLAPPLPPEQPGDEEPKED